LKGPSSSAVAAPATCTLSQGLAKVLPRMLGGRWPNSGS